MFELIENLTADVAAGNVISTFAVSIIFVIIFDQINALKKFKKMK
jgi:hypothetical protein